MIERDRAIHEPNDHLASALGQRHEAWHTHKLERIHRPPIATDPPDWTNVRRDEWSVKAKTTALPNTPAT